PPAWLATAAGLAVAAGGPGAAEEPPAFSGQRALAHLETIVNLGPRPSGSAAMGKQRELLAAHFRAAGAAVRGQAFQIRDRRTGAAVQEKGNRYVLSTMLGVTAGRGNTVREIVRGLERSAAAAGTTPAGTSYFVTSDDVRTKTRSPAFPPIVQALEKLGVAARIVPGPLPKRCRDVAGLMTGTADFDWTESGSTIVPGAICENLTSFGGVFTPQAGQTPLSAFIRAGAAGSSGTVIEPYALQAKFPHAALHVHDARGATLAEAFYQSVQAPYQLLVVGDPLCRPWATIPRVEVALAAEGREIGTDAPLTGRIELAPASPDAVEHITLNRADRRNAFDIHTCFA
ncbi:MAG: hypothetical protein ACKOTB_09410, partial [Planctomycetia bacterium]